MALAYDGAEELTKNVYVTGENDSRQLAVVFCFDYLSDRKMTFSVEIANPALAEANRDDIRAALDTFLTAAYARAADAGLPTPTA